MLKGEKNCRFDAALWCAALLSGTPAMLPAATVGEFELTPITRITVHVADQGNVSESETISRLRDVLVGVDATSGETWRTLLEYSLADEVQHWRNAWLQRRFGSHFIVRAGFQNTGVGLEGSAPGAESPFLERSALSALTPGNLTGVQLQWVAPAYSLRLGAFGDRDLDHLPDRRGSSGHSVVARALWRLHWSEDWGTSVGATVERRLLGAEHGVDIGWQTSSALLAAQARAVPLVADDGHFQTRGVEATAFRGPLTLSAEHLTLTVADHRAAGWTATGAWVLRGQRRIYRQGSGGFAGLPGLKWPGALELTARASQLALDATHDKRDLTVVLNWYPTAHARLAVQTSREVLRRPAALVARRNVVFLLAQFRLGAAE